jgi:hypothetical protein
MSIELCNACSVAIDTDYKDPYVKITDDETVCLCDSCLLDNYQYQKQRYYFYENADRGYDINSVNHHARLMSTYEKALEERD